MANIISWLKPGGWTIIVEPDRPAVEKHSFTCSHCNGVTFVPARHSPTDELGGKCYVCDGLICMKCVHKVKTTGQKCTPMAKRMEQIEEAHYKRYGLVW